MTKEEITKGLESVKKECGMHLDESFAWICEPIDGAIKALEQQPSEDCVSRQAVLDALMKCEKPCDDRQDFYLESTMDFEEEIKELPPVTPTQCIAAVRFSKEDLREICNERIGMECIHGTCKDCKHYVGASIDNTDNIYKTSYCRKHDKNVYREDFYCADFEKRGSEE